LLHKSGEYINYKLIFIEKDQNLTNDNDIVSNNIYNLV